MKFKFLIFSFILILLFGSSAFAITQEQFMEYVNYAIDNLPTSNNRQRWMFINLKNSNWFTTYFFTNYGNILSKANTIRVYGTTNAAGSPVTSVSFGIYFYKAKDSTIFYYNSTDSIAFSDLDILENGYECYYVNFTVNANNNNTTVGNNGYQHPTNIPFSNGFNNNSANVSFVNTVNKQIMNNSGGTSVTSNSYYFKNFNFTPDVPPAPAWSFEKYYSSYLNFSVLEKQLGFFSGDASPEDFQYIFFDYTTQSTVYNSADWSLSSKPIYWRNKNLYIQTRYLTNHEYDLYILKDGEETQQFHYIFTFSSGDLGWTGQDTTNNIINNNDENTQDVIGSLTRPASFSGDYNYLISGDNLANKLGKDRFDLPSRVTDVVFYLNTITGQIRQVLTTSEVYTITIPYMNRNLVIKSSDFTIPDGPIKTIATNFITFVVCCLIFKHVVSVIHSIQEGNVNAILNKTSVNDDSIFL